MSEAKRSLQPRVHAPHPRMHGRGSALGKLARRFAPICRADEPLAPHTTLRVGGSARLFLMPRSIAETQSVVAALGQASVRSFVLGGGANVLFRPEGWAGAVVNLSCLRWFRLVGERLIVGAGTPLALVIRRAMEQGLTGMEGLVGIPGTIGGAVRMNAGGHATSLSELVESIEVVDSAGRHFVMRHDQIGFGYRRSALGGLTIVSATLRVRAEGKGAKQAICERMAALLNKKRLSQPMGQRSAGCTFKNPSKLHSAGALIDQLGLKGLRVGGAVVSSAHANFIVNDNRATADDVLELIRQIRRVVLAASGVALCLEVCVVGEA